MSICVCTCPDIQSNCTLVIQFFCIKCFEKNVSCFCFALVLITWHSSCKATKLTISYLVYPLLWKDWKLCIMLWMSIFVLHDTTNFTDQQTFRYYAPESTIWQICSNFAGKPESILQFAESVESYMLLYTLWQWLKSLWIFPSSCKVVSGIKF